MRRTFALVVEFGTHFLHLVEHAFQLSVVHFIGPTRVGGLGGGGVMRARRHLLHQRLDPSDIKFLLHVKVKLALKLLRRRLD